MLWELGGGIGLLHGMRKGGWGVGGGGVVTCVNSSDCWCWAGSVRVDGLLLRRPPSQKVRLHGWIGRAGTGLGGKVLSEACLLR